MASFSFVAFLVFLYVMSGALFCLPVILWHRSIGWRWWEFILPLVPFGLWICPAIFSGKGKTLSNAVIEPLLCGCVACIPFVLKATAERRGWHMGKAYFVGLTISCVFVLIIYIGTPALPE